MLSLLLTILATVPATDRNLVLVELDFHAPTTPISRYIYGANDTQDFVLPWTVYRFGGNAATTYNWENNFDNAGKDWHHNSAHGWSMRWTPEDQRDVPAAALINHHRRALELGADTLIQVNLMGFFAADGDGPVSEAEVAPSPRWKRVVARKPGPFSDPPNLEDDVVYVDEMVHHLVQRFGRADSPTGIDAWALDNEPGLWDSTHPRAHPHPPLARELVRWSIETARAIKDVDPSARIHGYQPFGVYEMIHFAQAPDWPEIQQEGGYEWFVDYFLHEFAKASEADGRRLLDVLDIHFYVESLVRSESGERGIAQAPRSMWDPTHVEGSWLGEVHPEFFPLIPKLKRSIERYFPGTELGISEWNAQDPNTPHGSLANADMLGVFGQEGVHLSTWWSLIDTKARDDQAPWASAAFRLFMNFDGQGGKFGDRSMRLVNPNPKDLSAFASLNSATGDLHVILICKRRHTSLNVSFTLPEGRFRTVEGWGYGETAGPEIRRMTDIPQNTEGEYRVEMTRQSALHLVFRR